MLRRSSRPRIRPLEFWNFEIADYSVSQDISYKLTRDSSISFLNSTKVKNPKGTNNLSKRNGTYSENNKTDKSKRKKHVEEDEYLPSITSTKEYKSRYNLRSPIVVIKKLKTQDRIEAKRKHIREAESNDSGITDLDATTSAQSGVSDIPADISSIHPVSENFLNALNLSSTSTQKSGQNKDYSYTRTRKSLTFQDAVSSTTVSEENINESFKVPHPKHKKLKKTVTVEPILESIVEEREDESMEIDGITHETTPKKRSALRRSRILDFEFGDDAIPETRKEFTAAERNDIAVSQQTTTSSIPDKAPANMSSSCERAGLNSKNIEDNPSDKIGTETNLSSVRRGNKDNGESLQKRNAKAKSDATVSTVNKKNRRQSRQSSEKQREEEKSNTDARTIDKRSGKNNDNITTDFPKRQTICTNAEIGRRSGRIRKKPLEFWNFETAEVKTLTNGEVSLVYTKRIDPSSEVSPVKRGVSPHQAFERKGKKNNPRIHKAQVDKFSPSKRLFSPSKRKLFSPETDTLDLPVESHESPTLRHRKSLGRVCTCDSQDPPDFTEFKSLHFHEWETDEFKCYLARNYRDLKRQIYSGFIFLVKGKMSWLTDKITTLFVICGEGTLKLLHSPTEGEEIVLEEKVKITIPVGKKVLLEISDGCDMLRLSLALQKVSSSSPSS